MRGWMCDKCYYETPLEKPGRLEIVECIPKPGKDLEVLFQCTKCGATGVIRYSDGEIEYD